MFSPTSARTARKKSSIRVSLDLSSHSGCSRLMWKKRLAVIALKENNHTIHPSEIRECHENVTSS